MTVWRTVPDKPLPFPFLALKSPWMDRSCKVIGTNYITNITKKQQEAKHHE